MKAINMKAAHLKNLLGIDIHTLLDGKRSHLRHQPHPLMQHAEAVFDSPL